MGRKSATERRARGRAMPKGGPTQDEGHTLSNSFGPLSSSLVQGRVVRAPPFLAGVLSPRALPMSSGASYLAGLGFLGPKRGGGGG
eukprot:6855689-Pyramimonas_sp.AAC.1